MGSLALRDHRPVLGVRTDRLFALSVDLAAWLAIALGVRAFLG